MKQSEISKAASAMGKIGGSVKCAKGFASRRVQAKAQKTRRINNAKKTIEISVLSKNNSYKCATQKETL
jgi:hypothetical protein